jgi:hypothetical protein
MSSPARKPGSTEWRPITVLAGQSSSPIPLLLVMHSEDDQTVPYAP